MMSVMLAVESFSLAVYMPGEGRKVIGYLLLVIGAAIGRFGTNNRQPITNNPH
jgi:hypothetical protein